MAKTIHTLAYMVTADTRSFKEGLVLTRNELKATKDIIESTRSPIKQFGSEVSSLGELHRKGAIDNMQYVSSLNQLIAGHTAGIPVIGRFTSVLSLGNPLMIAGAAAAAALAAGFVAVGGAVTYAGVQISKQITAIDDLIASASTIGIAVNSFQALGHAAESADIDIGAMGKGIESMLSAISKGAGGSARIVKVFDLIGLDAKVLKEMKPEDQILKITKALDGMANQSDRTRAAQAIFGSADFLRLDASHIEHATALLKALGGGLDDLDESKFGAFDQAVNDMNFALDVSWKRLTMQVVPALGSMAEELTNVLKQLNGAEGFAKTLEGIGDSLIVIIAVAKELPGVMGTWMAAIEAANPKLMLLTRLAPSAASAGNPFSDIISAEKRRRDLDSQLAGRGGQREETTALEDSAEAAKDYAKELEHVADAQAKAYQSGLDLVGGLAKEIATFGMTSREAALYSAAVAGASPIELSFAHSLGKTIEAMEERKKLTDEMTSALKAARTPEERFRDDILKLRDALLRGIISGSDYIKLRDKAAEGLTTPRDRPAGVAAMMKGSSAAESFLAEVRVRGTGAKDKSDIMIKILDSIDKHIVEGKERVATTVPRLGAS